MDANRQLGEVSLALETYRRLLPPGIYHFAAEIQDGKPTGKILEEREDYQKKEDESSGVTFGFYPLGFIPEDLQHRPVLEWLFKYPFIARVTDLFQAPEGFVDALSRHVNRRIYGQI